MFRISRKCAESENYIVQCAQQKTQQKNIGNTCLTQTAAKIHNKRVLFAVSLLSVPIFLGQVIVVVANSEMYCSREIFHTSKGGINRKDTECQTRTNSMNKTSTKTTTTINKKIYLCFSLTMYFLVWIFSVGTSVRHQPALTNRQCRLGRWV